MDKRFPVACEGCQKEPCPYEGNEFAFARVGRVGHCAFNPKAEEKEEAKKKLGWKRSRNK
jgi:hypothetical protein